MAAEGQPDGINWFRTWASALQSARDDMQNLVKTPSAATSVAEIASASGEQIKQISSRLDKWLEASTDLFGNVDYSSAAALSALNRGVETGENSEQQISHFIGEGDVDRLVLKSTDDSTAKARLQTAAVVAVICLGIAAAFLTRIAAVEDSVYRYPHALGVLAGIVYWAWLWPSWLGMMILVASAGLALKFSWPGRSIRPESSTVLRSTRTF
jgi:hypothetical protein